MTLSDSSTALFDANALGDGLIQTLQLPAEIFPRTGTWNQFSSLTEPARSLLSTNAFNLLDEEKMHILSCANMSSMPTMISRQPRHIGLITSPTPFPDPGPLTVRRSPTPRLRLCADHHTSPNPQSSTVCWFRHLSLSLSLPTRC